MTLDHSRIEELMAVEALGGLDGEDRDLLARERAEHGDCAECRTIEDGFAETAGRLGFALSPLPVDDSIVDAIVSGPHDRLAAGPRDELAGRRERPGRGWRTLATAAAVVAVLLVALATLRPSTTGVTEASPTQRFVTFSGEGEGTLAMAYTPGRPGAVFWGRDLPDPGPDMALRAVSRRRRDFDLFLKHCRVRRVRHRTGDVENSHLQPTLPILKATRVRVFIVREHSS